MTTKVIRVESDCEQIIRKYCPMGSVTDGIRLMDKMLTEKGMKILEEKIVPLSAQSPSLVIPGGDYKGGMSPEYWKEIEKVFDKVVKEYAGR